MKYRLIDNSTLTISLVVIILASFFMGIFFSQFMIKDNPKYDNSFIINVQSRYVTRMPYKPYKKYLGKMDSQTFKVYINNGTFSRSEWIGWTYSYDTIKQMNKIGE